MTLRNRPILGSIIWITCAAFCAGLLTLAAAYLYLDPQTPSAESFRHVRLETPLRIYARDDRLIAEFGERRVIPIGFDQIPRQFINAVVSTEDKRFYEHAGIDLVSLTNDSFNLLKSLLFDDRLGPGASTITMQLARNVSFGLERTFIRKFKEMLLALKIEQELSKDEILTLYINIVPFGKRAYGAEAAARTYYGRSLTELDLAELAMLAGIPQSPSAANPINGPERALARRNVVLSRMLEQGAISREEYDDATARPLTARLFDPQLDVAAPYAAEWVRQQLIATYPDLYTAGYEVHTTIDADLQRAATDALRGGLDAYDRRHGYRGPEARLPEEDMALLADDPVAGRERARDAANAQPAYQGLEPAVVIASSRDEAQLIINTGEVITLPLAAAQWARPYIDENSRGPAPTAMTDILTTGDIVRLRRLEAGWELSQIPGIQGALVSVEPETGKLLAMVGGYDYAISQFNHATQAARQPGSGFKPIVYGAAINHGVTPDSTYMDAPLVFNERGAATAYKPKNDNNKYNGPTRLRQALYRSINLVTIRVLLDIEAGTVMDFAGHFGFDTTGFPRNTQLAIGGGTMTVTPLDMVRAYSVFANGGYLVDPYTIASMTDSEGNKLIDTQPVALCAPGYVEPPVVAVSADMPTAEPAPAVSTIADASPAESDPDVPESSAPAPAPCRTPAIDPRVAFIMTDMLRDVIKRGTARRALSLKRADIAGKTGTTDEAADTWFNGFSADVATTVWVGFDSLKPLGRREYGSTTPLSIWIDYMKAALAERPERFREQPDGIVNLRVGGNGNSEFEYFLADHLPAQHETSSPDRVEKPEIQSVDLF
ncbi:MAG: PBP1A family penicillin-binding protein [Pseudomonadales bacterium]|nr:PBP1A family penicillin-binding protein [Pseudomonadales bacterium]